MLNKIRHYINNYRTILHATYSDFKMNKRHLANRQNGGTEVDFATLRMYCHMLDKAMNRPSFEKGHSKDVYKKARELQNKLCSDYAQDTAFTWASEILNKFENAQISGIIEIEQCDYKTYDNEEKKFISQFISSRTSCRNFIEKEMPSDVLNEIVRLAADAPNGCCRQSVRYYITQNKELIGKLVPNVAGITNFTNIQGLVAVCSESSFYELCDKYLQYVDASLSAENFILAARVYGIFGTMCNFFHANEVEQNNVRKILGIKESENVVMFMAIGYPSKVPCKPERRDVSSFLKIRN